MWEKYSVKWGFVLFHIFRTLALAYKILIPKCIMYYLRNFNVVFLYKCVFCFHLDLEYLMHAKQQQVTTAKDWILLLKLL